MHFFSDAYYIKHLHPGRNLGRGSGRNLGGNERKQCNGGCILNAKRDTGVTVVEYGAGAGENFWQVTS